MQFLRETLYGALVTSGGPATREFRDELVRIAELTVVDDRIASYTFSNCEVVGPAILAPSGDTSFVRSKFDAPDAESLLWPIPSSRSNLLGVVVVVDCLFSGCRFRNIGLAVPEAFINTAREGFAD